MNGQILVQEWKDPDFRGQDTEPHPSGAMMLEVPVTGAGSSTVSWCQLTSDWWVG